MQGKPSAPCLKYPSIGRYSRPRKPTALRFIENQQTYAQTFSSTDAKKYSLMPWNICCTKAYTILSDEGASLRFQRVLSKRSASLVSVVWAQVAESMPDAKWLSFTSAFGLMSCLSFVTDPKDDSWGRPADIELPLAADCSVPPNESKNWRSPARFYNLTSHEKSHEHSKAVNQKGKQWWTCFSLKGVLKLRRNNPVS